MNERIKQLAEQAEINRFAYNQATMMNERVQEFDKEKFAELIVGECMKVLAESREVRQTAYYYRNRIAKHFGVEE
jgi:hypothetical protein